MVVVNSNWGIRQHCALFLLKKYKHTKSDTDPLIHPNTQWLVRSPISIGRNHINTRSCTAAQIKNNLLQDVRQTQEKEKGRSNTYLPCGVIPISLGRKETIAACAVVAANAALHPNDIDRSCWRKYGEYREEGNNILMTSALKHMVAQVQSKGCR